MRSRINRKADNLPGDDQDLTIVLFIIYKSLPEIVGPVRRPRARWKYYIHKEMHKMRPKEVDRERWWQVVGARLKYQIGF